METKTPVSVRDFRAFLYKLFDKYMPGDESLEISTYIESPKITVGFSFTSNQSSLKLKIIDEIRKGSGKRGWYVDNAGDDKTILSKMYVMIHLDPKIDDEVDFKTQYLYHVTLEKNLKTIAKKGIIPKKQDTFRFSNPERIYLFTDISHAGQLNSYFKDTHGDNKFIVLEIDTHKLGKHVKFYKDMRLPRIAVYTKSHIPMKAVSKIVPYDMT